MDAVSEPCRRAHATGPSGEAPGVWKTFPIVRRSQPAHSVPMAFQVCPRLLVDPHMWTVDVRDTATSAVVWSSWAHEWTAYQTLEEARNRGGEIVRLMTASRRSVA